MDTLPKIELPPKTRCNSLSHTSQLESKIFDIIPATDLISIWYWFQYFILLQLLVDVHNMGLHGSYYVKHLCFTRGFATSNTILGHSCPWCVSSEQQSVSSLYQVSNWFLLPSLTYLGNEAIFFHSSLLPYILSPVSSTFLEQITKFHLDEKKKNYSLLLK